MTANNLLLPTNSLRTSVNSLKKKVTNVKTSLEIVSTELETLDLRLNKLVTESEIYRAKVDREMGRQFPPPPCPQKKIFVSPALWQLLSAY